MHAMHHKKNLSRGKYGDDDDIPNCIQKEKQLIAEVQFCKNRSKHI